MIMLSFVLLICGDLHSQGIQPSSGISIDEYVHTLHSSGTYTNISLSDPSEIKSTVRIRTQTVPSDSVTFLFPISLNKELRAECRNDLIMFTGESAGFWQNVSQGRTVFIRNTAHIICSEVASSCLHTNPDGKSIKEIFSSDIPSEKSPVLAGLLSLFLPGTGQAYNGQWIKAGIQWTLLAGSLYMAVADVNFESFINCRNCGRRGNVAVVCHWRACFRKSYKQGKDPCFEEAQLVWRYRDHGLFLESTRAYSLSSHSYRMQKWKWQLNSELIWAETFLSFTLLTPDVLFRYTCTPALSHFRSHSCKYNSCLSVPKVWQYYDTSNFRRL